MDVKKELLKEHSRRQSDKIARYACKSEKHFKELMICYFSKNNVVAQRAAWSMSNAARNHPALIMPYIKDLTDFLFRKDVHNAVIRNAVRVLEILEIPKKYQGRIMQACFKFLEDYSTPPAIKAFSMTTLFNLSKQYPEIRSELKTIIESHWEHETPAFKSRGRKILEQFKKTY